MAKLDEQHRVEVNPEPVIAMRRSGSGVETLVEWLESLAARARRSWMDRRARVPFRPPR